MRRRRVAIPLSTRNASDGRPSATFTPKLSTTTISEKDSKSWADVRSFVMTMICPSTPEVATELLDDEGDEVVGGEALGKPV